MYSMIQTRSNICFAVTILSRFNQNLNFKYYAAVKRIIRYLKDILYYEIIYDLDNDLEGYIDANWVFDSETRRSLRVYIFLLYGEAIS